MHLPHAWAGWTRITADAVEGRTLENLKSIQAGLAEVGLRLDRRKSAGMPVRMRARAGDFDARVTDVEERIGALEARG